MFGTDYASVGIRERHAKIMIKQLNVITEAIRDSKHPFRKADDQPKKDQKHRYERRKIKEYLHLGAVVLTEETA